MYYCLLTANYKYDACCCLGLLFESLKLIGSVMFGVSVTFQTWLHTTVFFETLKDSTHSNGSLQNYSKALHNNIVSATETSSNGVNALSKLALNK